jgi:hypothetical protein
MSWIKIETNITTKPEVMQLAAVLEISEFEVVGHLVAFWSWVDANMSPECPAVIGTKSGLDRVCGRDGMVDALVDVGWLQHDGKMFSIPNIDRHLSKSAKQRAIEARKKAGQRKSRKCPDENGTKKGQVLSSLISSNSHPKDVNESQAVQFAEFWKAYPKKKDKGAAERAFKRAIQNATFAQIMSAVAKYALEQIEPQYRKHPATWLNARAWEDEQPDSPKKSNPMGFMNELLARKSRGEITEDEFQNIVFQEMNRRD